MADVAEEYQKFIDFDWTDERWTSYFEALYPAPNPRQVLKFKKKWYKKHVEPEFDEAYEPPYVTSSRPAGASSSAEASMPFANAVQGDGERWVTMGPKTTICFLAYGVALLLCVAAVAGAFPSYQALVTLVGAFILEVLAKYGLKFNTAYMQAVLLDDVGVMPMMSLTLLTPGLHPIIRILALVPPFLTALMSFASIAKHHPRLPAQISSFFAPLAETSARYQVMQVRADVEVGLGLVLVIGVFCIRAAPISALLFWNFMMMRYMMSPWTQASFRKADGFVSPVLNSIPLVNRGYAAAKRGIYSFVDPAQKKGSSFCSVL